MLFKRKRIPFPIPNDARELTEEEMILVNGGGKEQGGQQGSQDNNGETQTVKKGDTLSQIVSDYNKEHGTDLSVSDVAKMSGISNPDLIYPGQKISFGNQVVTGVTSAPQKVTQVSPSIGGNIGSRHTVSSEKNYSNEINVSNQSTRPISAASAIIPATTASRKNTADTQTAQAEATAPTSNAALGVPATTINTEPKYESTYYNQMVEKLKVQAAKDGIRGTSTKGEEISGKLIEGQNIDSHSGNLTERGYPGSRDENLGIYYGTESIGRAKNENSGFTTEVPSLDGAYVVFMGDGTYHSGSKKGQHANEHAALLIIENGAMTVWDNSLGNSTGGVDSTDVYALSNTRLSEFTLYESFYFRKID